MSTWDVRTIPTGSTVTIVATRNDRKAVIRAEKVSPADVAGFDPEADWRLACAKRAARS